MHVVDPVVHDCRGDVFARHPLSPGGRHIQVQLGLSTILAGVFLFRSKHNLHILSPIAYFAPAHEQALATYQVPLVLEKRISRICLWREIDEVLDLEGIVASLLRSVGWEVCTCVFAVRRMR